MLQALKPGDWVMGKNGAQIGRETRRSVSRLLE